MAAEEVAHLELAGDPVPRQHQLEVRQLQLVHEVRGVALARGGNEEKEIMLSKINKSKKALESVRPSSYVITSTRVCVMSNHI